MFFNRYIRLDAVITKMVRLLSINTIFFGY